MCGCFLFLMFARTFKNFFFAQASNGANWFAYENREMKRSETAFLQQSDGLASQSTSHSPNAMQDKIGS